MPTPINFTEFTDEVVLWENKDAVNQFFSDITVPDATDSTAGVMTKAANVSAPVDITYLTINVTDETGTVTPYVVVSKSNYDELKSKVVSILLAMKAAGIMVGD